MGFILDSILKHYFWDDETINATEASDHLDISGVEEAYSVQVVWDSGSSVNMTLSLECTNTPDVSGSWVQITDSEQIISGDSGSHIWDVSETGICFLRVKSVVSAGSGDFTAIFTGKRRH